MVETRQGGDRERTTSADPTRSMDSHNLREELEVMKLNHDKIAREGRSMATKIDSMEKMIDAIGTESTTRFE